MSLPLLPPLQLSSKHRLLRLSPSAPSPAAASTCASRPRSAALLCLAPPDTVSNVHFFLPLLLVLWVRVATLLFFFWKLAGILFQRTGTIIVVLSCHGMCSCSSVCLFSSCHRLIVVRIGLHEYIKN